jgi:hypothetical protein
LGTRWDEPESNLSESEQAVAKPRALARSPLPAGLFNNLLSIAASSHDSQLLHNSTADIMPG